MDGRRMLNYKLIYGPKGSGEVKTRLCVPICVFLGFHFPIYTDQFRRGIIVSFKIYDNRDD